MKRATRNERLSGRAAPENLAVLSRPGRLSLAWAGLLAWVIMLGLPGLARAQTFALTAGNMTAKRMEHTATRLLNGKVLITGGKLGDGGSVLASAEIYNPQTGTFTATGSMSGPRVDHTATLLDNGKVLIAGDNGNNAATAELYDPAGNSGAGSFTLTTGSMLSRHWLHQATKLNNGKVLITGGSPGFNRIGTAAEIYDPATDTFTATGAMIVGRSDYTATKFDNGKVLITGGYNDTSGALASAEIYDPAGNGGAGTFTLTGSMNTARYNHTATLLDSGKVLIAGGQNSSGNPGVAELYDPVAGTFSATGSLNAGRTAHTATKLLDGKVLIAAGSDGSGEIASAELYDPAAGTFTSTGSLVKGRFYYTATMLLDGSVLVTGGQNAGGATATAEVYTPPVTSGNPTNGTMNSPREGHTATLLPNGKVLITGGFNGSSYLASAEIYDPATGAFTLTGSMTAARYGHTATLLNNGTVLVVGGQSIGNGFLASAEIFDPAGNGGAGAFTLTGSMNATRFLHTATLLTNGKVLVAGGCHGTTFDGFAGVEIYDPANNSFTSTASLSAARQSHTATLLNSGKVLIAGGTNNGALATAELFDPAGNGGAGAFSAAGTMNGARFRQTASLLPNGKVLIAGGESDTSNLATAEIYDSAGNGGTGAFTPTASMNSARYLHTATLLTTGKVLLAGGSSGSGILNSTELFDPAGNGGAGTFSPSTIMSTPRYAHTATMLNSGKVLLAGGDNGVRTLASAELYSYLQPVTHFVVTAPAAAAAGVPFSITVEARDAGNNVVTGYTGTVHFTSTDTAPGTALPANATLTNGTGTFNVTLRTPGSQTITATDTVSSSLIGTSSTITVMQPPAITSANNATFRVGAAGTFTFTTTGLPTPTLVKTGTLPSGITFVDNGNGTATLSGTPAIGTGGAYSLTITASNGVGTDASQSFTLKVTTTAADFNGDGHSDLVLQNSESRQVAFWFTNGPSIVGSSYALAGFGPISFPPNWQVVGVGDVDGDGKPDLVLDNTSTGQIAVWFTNGSTITGGAYVTSGGGSIALPSGWQIVGVADFNHDGKPDLVLQNTSSHLLALWYMAGTSVTSGSYITYGGGLVALPAGWQVEGTGDFNGDGQPDLLLDNPSTGQIAVWIINGANVASGAYLTYGGSPITLPAGWQIAGVCDYNGDGTPDLVLQNLTSRLLAFWYTTGTGLSGSTYVLADGGPINLPGGWQVVGPR